MAVRSGYADLPLHGGRVPRWLAERMSRLGGAIIEALVMEHGKSGVLARFSDPMWFQSLGCVMGMDWHSSGVTTSVIGALKRALAPRARDLGIYVCGGRGGHARKTPDEISVIADRHGLNGDMLIRSSRLSAKIDNTAIQDGFQIYLHGFFVSDEGEWAIVQQGMNGERRMARRYHWHSANVRCFVSNPHTAVVGEHQGQIINLVHHGADKSRNGIVALSHEHPEKMLAEITKVLMPWHHDVRDNDVDLKRLGSVLMLAHEKQYRDFASLLLTRGLGPRTLQSLALVAEVIHGTPIRFQDPARFSLALGGKDGHPFLVPLQTYDATLSVLEEAVHHARLCHREKLQGIKRIHHLRMWLEKRKQPCAVLQKVVQREREQSPRFGGRTVHAPAGRDRVAVPAKPRQLCMIFPDTPKHAEVSGKLDGSDAAGRDREDRRARKTPPRMA